MNRTLLLALASAAVCGEAFAQSNSRGPGYDAALSNISSPRAYGRRGAAHPGGEVGLAFQNQLCNPGSIPIEWRAPMLADHPFFSFMVARLDATRIVQVSDWSYCKHAFLSLNSPSTCGGSCVQPPAGGSQLGVRCSDIYSNGNNGDRNYLGPPEEIDPWLGNWRPVGSYFDRGDPDVGVPGNTDGARSTINVGTDAVKNRVTVRENEVLGVPSGNLFFQIQVVCQGEPASNRANNTMSRPFNLTWNGTAWSANTTGLPAATTGTILTRWPGAQIDSAGNGNDDGRFLIASKITGPVNGLWHYEYAVLNLDNHRGGAGFRLPVCPTARVQNLGFRDIDTNALNNWTATVGNGEIAWTAPSTNPQNWNMLFNFWFDSDAAPSSGSATIDQARIGAGALSFAVPTQVPGLQHGVYTGIGCGAPGLELRANGVPSAGNTGFAIDMVGAPNMGALVFYSFAGGNVPVAPGCTQWLDTGLIGAHGFMLLDGSGNSSIPLGVPVGFAPLDLHWQAATILPSGPLFGSYGLSNGLLVRLAGSTCQ
ncbi:MAG: hypothetical protein JNK49_02400 [Planctomycetes bacterium]|nr:hypothetical protein [Planctomycetota bacterium]